MLDLQEVARQDPQGDGPSMPKKRRRRRYCSKTLEDCLRFGPHFPLSIGLVVAELVQEPKGCNICKYSPKLKSTIFGAFLQNAKYRTEY